MKMKKILLMTFTACSVVSVILLIKVIVDIRHQQAYNQGVVDTKASLNKALPDLAACLIKEGEDDTQS